MNSQQEIIQNILWQIGTRLGNQRNWAVSLGYVLYLYFDGVIIAAQCTATF